MKNFVLALAIGLCIPLSVMAQNENDDLYYVPSKSKEVKAVKKVGTVPATRIESDNVVVSSELEPSSDNSSATVSKVIVKDKNGNTIRDVDAYNRRYTYRNNDFYTDENGDMVVQRKKNGHVAYDEDMDGEWVNGFEGDDMDYEYATRIIRFRNPRFAISISSPMYWDIVYGLNSWEWNIYVDDFYAYAFPRWTNRLWWDWRYNSYGLGWGWNSWYSWYDPWYSPWYGWGGWYSPWYAGWGWNSWYGGWYAGWNYSWGYYGPRYWGGSHWGWSAPHRNYTWRGEPGYRSNYRANTHNGNGMLRGNSGSVRSNVSVRNNGTILRDNNGVRSNGSVRSAGSTVRSNSGIRTNGVRRVVGEQRINSNGTSGIRSNSSTYTRPNQGPTVRNEFDNPVRSNGTGRQGTYRVNTPQNRYYGNQNSSNPSSRSNSSYNSGTTRSNGSSMSSGSIRSNSGSSYGGATRSSGGGGGGSVRSNGGRGR